MHVEIYEIFPLIGVFGIELLNDINPNRPERWWLMTQ